MSNYQKGKNYEDFIEVIFAAIILAEKNIGRLAHIKLERNILLNCKSGASAEIDIYWEYMIAEILFRVAIECKNSKRKVEIGDIHEFSNKINSIGSIKGLIISPKGFSKNAILEAQHQNIDLRIIREKKTEDWNGLLKKVNIQLRAIVSARTIKMIPIFNRRWALDNGFKLGDTLEILGLNNEIIFIEESSDFRYSLLDLEKNNFFISIDSEYCVWKKDFDDTGWVEMKSGKLKLDSIEIHFNKMCSLNSEINIDLEDFVLAIQEYVESMEKSFIMIDGTKKEYSS
jgi:hypothetical protein